MGAGARKIDARADDLRKLRDSARAYYSARARRDEATREMEAARRVGLAMLDRVNARTIRFSDVVPSRYQIVKVRWNVAGLLKFLEEKVSPEAAGAVAKVVVDEKALEKIVEAGSVSLDDAHRFADEISQTWGFRVDRAKSNEPDGE